MSTNTNDDLWKGLKDFVLLKVSPLRALCFPLPIRYAAMVFCPKLTAVVNGRYQ